MRNADARVPDLDLEDVCVRFVSSDLNRNGSLKSVLECVGNKNIENLRESHRIRVENLLVGVELHMRVKREALLVNLLLVEFLDFFENGPQLELRKRELDGWLLQELRVIQNISHLVEHQPRVLLQRFGQLVDFLGVRNLQNLAAQDGHAVKGRLEVVRDRRQDAIFVLVHLAQPLL